VPVIRDQQGQPSHGEQHHGDEQRVLRAGGDAGREQGEGAVVGQHHPGDVAGDDGADLHPRDRRGGHHREVDGSLGRPEQVPPQPERVRDRGEGALALAHQEREVMGHRVGEHDGTSVCMNAAARAPLSCSADDRAAMRMDV
jgi:hypothetical protein